MEKNKLLEKEPVNLDKIVELLNNKTISFDNYQQQSRGILFNNKYFIKGFFSIKDLEKQIEKEYCKFTIQNEIKSNNIIYDNTLSGSFLRKLDRFSKIKLNYYNNNKELNNFSFSKKDVKKINELYNMGVKTIKYKNYEIDFEKVILNYKQKKKDECIKKVFNLREYGTTISGIQNGTIINNIDKENKLKKLVNIINNKIEKTEKYTIKHETLSEFSMEIMKDLYELQTIRQTRINKENAAKKKMLDELGSAANELVIDFTLNGGVRFF